MTARIAPVEPPFDPELQERLDKIMPPGVAPLKLFTTVARDKRLFERLRGGSLVDKGNLTLRQREIVIDRITASIGLRVRVGRPCRLFCEARWPYGRANPFAGKRQRRRCGVGGR